jgi:hypothetical protein
MSLATSGACRTVVPLLAAPVVIPPVPAPAAEDLKIALVAPLSGRWTRQGQLKKMGATSIEEVNTEGGIKALGGASSRCARRMPATASGRRRAPRSAPLTRQRISAGIGSSVDVMKRLASTDCECVARCLEGLGHEVIVGDPNFANSRSPLRRRRPSPSTGSGDSMTCIESE